MPRSQKKQCKDYFNAIANKIAEIVGYLDVIRKCIDELNETTNLQSDEITEITKRLGKLENFVSLPKGKCPVENVRQYPTEKPTKNAK